MSMFPALATTKTLLNTGSKPDIGFSVRTWNPPGFRYRRGAVWSFWITDDPRSEQSVKHIAKYKCVKSGGDDAEWERQGVSS